MEKKGYLLEEKKFELSQQQWDKSSPYYYNRELSFQHYMSVEEATKNAVEEYLENIKYATDVKNRLVFPETKFEFKYTTEGKITVEQKQ